MGIVKILFAGGIAYSLFGAGSKALDRITWQLHPVALADIKIFRGGYDMRVTITNNTDLPISLTGYQGHVSRAGQVIGDINSRGGIELPAKSTKTVQAFVKLKEGALDQLQHILDNGGLLKAPITINSYLKTTLIDLPIRKTVEFLKIS
jgi:hypothetical protein